MRLVTKVFLSILFFTCLNSWADELVVIKDTENCGQTFSILKGSIEDIEVGVSKVFTVKNISVLARAMQVSDYYSEWRLVNTKACVPFQKGEYVLINTPPETIYSQMAMLEKMHPLELDKLKERANVIRAPYFWGVRTFFSYTVSESISETQNPYQLINRAGAQFEGFYGRPVKKIHHLEWETSVRYDWENSKIKNPRIDIPTQRILASLGLVYHFSQVKLPISNFYTGLSFGFGYSRTKSESTILQGYAILLPAFKLGYKSFFKNRDYQGIVELKIEGLSSKEKRKAPSETQTNNIVNVSLGVGLRF